MFPMVIQNQLFLLSVIVCVMREVDDDDDDEAILEAK